MNKYKFTKENLINIAIGLGIAALGGVLTYLQALTLGSFEAFGMYAPIAYSINCVIVNGIKEFIRDK